MIHNSADWLKKIIRLSHDLKTITCFIEKIALHHILPAFLRITQICPGLNANEIQIPYDKHHKVSSLVKSHLNTHNSVKYKVV